MQLILRIWRQEQFDIKGEFVDYALNDLQAEMSLLEALDHLNEQLVLKGERVVAFDYDCREGICGQCGIFVNGRAHGPLAHTTTCQVHLRAFKAGSIITLEPWRAHAFPLIQDLMVDRTSMDRIIEKGGYISANTGTAPEANSILIGKAQADGAMDAAACIGCGACIASCKNASAALFTAAKVNHLNSLPQGKPEAHRRTRKMVNQMSIEGFGHCSLTGACAVECPAEIDLKNIAELNFRIFLSQIFQ